MAGTNHTAEDVPQGAGVWAGGVSCAHAVCTARKKELKRNPASIAFSKTTTNSSAQQGAMFLQHCPQPGHNPYSTHWADSVRYWRPVNEMESG